MNNNGEEDAPAAAGKPLRRRLRRRQLRPSLCRLRRHLSPPERVFPFQGSQGLVGVIEHLQVRYPLTLKAPLKGELSAVRLTDKSAATARWLSLKGELSAVRLTEGFPPQGLCPIRGLSPPEAVTEGFPARRRTHPSLAKTG